MIYKFFCILSLASVVAACTGQSRGTKSPINKQPPSNVKITETATPAPAATSESSKIKTYKGKGVVTKINLELVSVELNHEEIKDLMPAMIMEFYVKEKSELEVLKVGDKVEFVLEDNAGAEKIINIKKM